MRKFIRVTVASLAVCTALHPVVGDGYGHRTRMGQCGGGLESTREWLLTTRPNSAIFTSPTGKVISKDGTSIAFDQSGKGPVVILVTGALSDRTATARLAMLLSAHFTVINYDRRGRGESGDTQPYSVDREVEDIEALIGEAGGEASLLGLSSGAALALEAAAAGLPVQRVVAYE